jgi:hypothetical protein
MKTKIEQKEMNPIEQIHQISQKSFKPTHEEFTDIVLYKGSWRDIFYAGSVQSTGYYQSFYTDGIQVKS